MFGDSRRSVRWRLVTRLLTACSTPSCGLFYWAMLRALLGSLRHPLILVGWSRRSIPPESCSCCGLPWIADRHFCTRAILQRCQDAQAGLIVRQHAKHPPIYGPCNQSLKKQKPLKGLALIAEQLLPIEGLLHALHGSTGKAGADRGSQSIGQAR